MRRNRVSKNIRDFIDNPVDQKYREAFYNSMSDSQKDDLNNDFAEILRLEIDRERLREEQGLAGEVEISDDAVHVWRAMQTQIAIDKVKTMLETPEATRLPMP
jgi:vacuolar-type H+-ATPase subunit C/Vma6